MKYHTFFSRKLSQNLSPAAVVIGTLMVICTCRHLVFNYNVNVFYLILPVFRGQKFHLSARNYELNLERTSTSSQSTRPVGRVLWEELLKEVVLHITPLCSLLHMLL